ncbi:hypothetical protein [Pseudomonas sp. CCC2.2]|uniref:hypothetical protein n=1 Tax=Pseudomonas sp. CCC2.2 TaxID=3048605 RepID=UPI002B235985|nr:hypothetical protein [Pseudomonas sp. CCC2.2]MEB0149948.1 hypothetical protein [Pseudomonas sp. CCC2.2]
MEDFDDLDRLPNLDHWKPVMEFTAEQAALLLAMIDPFDATLDSAKRQRLPRWKHAHGHALGIVSAIRQGLITPIVCKGYVWVEVPDGYHGVSRERTLCIVKVTDREAEISPADTIITRASLVGWIASEKVSITKPQRPTPAVPKLSPALTPTIIEANPAPLKLPYYGHTSEGLEFVDDAIKQMWSTYDEDDPSTSPTQEDVIKYLREKGAGVNMAEAVNLVLRPANLRRGGRKSKKAPT